MPIVSLFSFYKVFLEIMFSCLFIGSSIPVVRFLENFNVANEHFLPISQFYNFPILLINMLMFEVVTVIE